MLILRRWHPRAPPTSLSRHHLRHGIAGTPSEPRALRRAHGLEPTCPGTRSAPSGSRLTSGSTSGSASTSSCATATTSTAPTSSSTERWSRWIGSLWSLWSLDALRRTGRRRGPARGLAAGAGVVLVPPPRRVRRTAAVGPPGQRRGRPTLDASGTSLDTKSDLATPGARRLRGLHRGPRTPSWRPPCLHARCTARRAARPSEGRSRCDRSREARRRPGHAPRR